MLPQCRRLLQISNMSLMKNIKASVCENNSFSLGFPRIHLTFCFLPAYRDISRPHHIGAAPCVDHFSVADRISSHSRHRNSSCRICQFKSGDHIQINSCCSCKYGHNSISRSGDIKDILCDRSTMCTSIFINAGNSLFRPGYKNIFYLKRFPHLSANPFNI